MHEQSETVQREDGAWINVYGYKTPQAGKQLPDSGEFFTSKDAVKAAKSRSASHKGTPMFDISAIDPNKLNELAFTANPFPILQQMTMSVNPQQQFGTQEVMQGGFGDMIFGSVGNPGGMGIAPGEWDWMKTGTAPAAKPGSAPLTPQQLASLQGMMGRQSEPRYPPPVSPGGGGARQVQMQQVFPQAPAVRKTPTLSELIGR
jgi:hypothetical protein